MRLANHKHIMTSAAAVAIASAPAPIAAKDAADKGTLLDATF